MSLLLDPYKSSSFIGHSLWFVPCGDSKIAYDSLIADASKNLETFRFIPHITLVAALLEGSETDVCVRTKKLASTLAPFTFEFDQLSHGDAYFKCVYAQMKRTETVVAANALARQFFPERSSDPEYIPHMSLVYGDFDDKIKQHHIIPTLENSMMEDQDDGVRNNSKGIAAAIASIQVDAIEVWSTEGDVKEWYKVETVPLTGVSSNNFKLI